MRLATALLAFALLAGCKKHAQPTLPQIPDSSQMAGGGTVESPEATAFHTIYRYSGHAGQVHAFYRPELEKRGAKLQGDVWTDDNLQHLGDFGSNGTATARDPGRPGVWVAVQELPSETRIDVWESVPNPR